MKVAACGVGCTMLVTKPFSTTFMGAVLRPSSTTVSSGYGTPSQGVFNMQSQHIMFPAKQLAMGAMVATIVGATRRDKRTQCRAFEGELGVQAPVGFWDPLGFTKDGDAEAFNRRRNTEIKHGRISMLATMGYITPEVAGKWPGYLSPSLDLKYADIPNGLGAISKVPGAGWLQIVAYCLYCESTGGFGYNSNTSSLEPGNCGWKPPLLATNNPELRRKRLNAELANGRLAMMAIIGMFFQDGLTGSAWGDWALYTDSPLRAATK